VDQAIGEVHLDPGLVEADVAVVLLEEVVAHRHRPEVALALGAALLAEQLGAL